MKEIQSKREANKVRKKETFLTAAEKLFVEKGFENTSIDEVVKNAGLSKRTLYQYFLNKEDLFYAVALKGARQLYEASTNAFSRGKNALEKIRLVNLAHLTFYKEHRNLFQILNTNLPNQNSASSPHYQEIRALDAKRMMYIPLLINAAASDGSINPKLDMKKAVLFGSFSAFSLLYTFAFTDNSFWKAMSIKEDEFLNFSFDLVVDALK